MAENVKSKFQASSIEQKSRKSNNPGKKGTYFLFLFGCSHRKSLNRKGKVFIKRDLELKRRRKT